MPPQSSCPCYTQEPFATLVSDFPSADMYPSRDFRIEWGPIFHRGRLDHTATVLVLGQDPAMHETISRRILVGEAGQRVEDLLGRLGVTRSYVMIDTFLYSVYGQGGGTRHAKDPAIAAYRNHWLDALLLNSAATAVITLGDLAKPPTSCGPRHNRRADVLHHAAIRHPTYPASSSRSGEPTLAEATAALLDNWNAALPGLAAVVADDPAPSRRRRTAPPGSQATCLPCRRPPCRRAARPGGSTWQPGPPVPGQTVSKRAAITVTVPTHARIWHDQP